MSLHMSNCCLSYQSVANQISNDGKHRIAGKMTTKSSKNERIPRSMVPFCSVKAVAVANLVAIGTANAETANKLLEETASSVYTLADGGIGDSFGGFLFSTGQQANEAVQDQLSALSFSSLAVIFGAGLVTSLSPCTLSVLPLTLGYIGAFGSGKSKMEVVGNSVAFSLGLATTLALLGIGASFAGKAYGQIGQGLPVAASALAVIMGLNLLEIVELRLPSFFDNFDPRSAAANFPSSVQAYLAGLTFALAASPCSTPVLASLLAYVASSKRLNMSLVVHHGWIRRQIRFKAEIDQLLQEVKDDMTESPAKKECQEHLEALVYLTAKTLEPRMLLYCKFRYAWAVIQSFVVGVLVPLVCFYILSRQMPSLNI